MNAKQIFVIAIIAMFLIVPFASAKQEVADNIKQDKIDEKVTDKTKEAAKEISNKDKDIKGKVTVTDSDSSKYTVEKKSKTEISIYKNEVKGEHTKSKVTFAKEDLQKIDIDGDKLYGVLHIADDGGTVHDVYTESQLIAGTEMIFSENIINGFSGSYTKTVSAGIQDNNITFPIKNGSIVYLNLTGASYSAFVEPTRSTWPNQANLAAAYSFNGNATPVVGPTPKLYNASWYSDRVKFSGTGYATFNKVLSSPSIQTIHIDFKRDGNGSGGANPGLLSSKATGWGFVWIPNAGTNVSARIYESDGSYITLPPVTNVYTGQRYTYDIVMNGTHANVYLNGIKKSATAYDGTIRIGSTNATIGEQGGEKFNGSIYNFAVWNNVSVAQSDLLKMYLGYAGSTFTLYPNTTRIPATGKSVTIAPPANTQSIRILSNANPTRTFSATAMFTENTTNILEQSNGTHYLIDTVFVPVNPITSGSIVHDLGVNGFDFDGTPSLNSNDSNSSVAISRGIVTVGVGYIPAGAPKMYNVTIPYTDDHEMWLNVPMEWTGSGWDYVSTLPSTWNQFIGDEIEVTVS